MTPGPRGYTTKDYAKLRDPLRLVEFRVSVIPYHAVPVINPFGEWDETAPARSRHDLAVKAAVLTVTASSCG
jgi:hypothetical protein